MSYAWIQLISKTDLSWTNCFSPNLLSLLSLRCDHGDMVWRQSRIQSNMDFSLNRRWSFQVKRLRSRSWPWTKTESVVSAGGEQIGDEKVVCHPIEKRKPAIGETCLIKHSSFMSYNVQPRPHTSVCLSNHSTTVNTLDLLTHLYVQLLCRLVSFKKMKQKEKKYKKCRTNRSLIFFCSGFVWVYCKPV